MTTIHLIYTFLLIIITIYLIILQYFNYSKYINLKYNFLININFYLILIFLVATFIAIFIVALEQVFIASGKILGEILTDCVKVAEHTNTELTKTHGTSNSACADVEVVPEAKSISSENQPSFKTTNSSFIQTEKNSNEKIVVDGNVKENTIVSEVKSKVNSKAKEISSNAKTKDFIPSPTENKKPNSFVERIFSSLSPKTQQYFKNILLSTAKEAVEKPTSPETKQVVSGILSSVLSEESKVYTPSELGIKDPNETKLQVPHFRAQVVEKDGSIEKVDCVNVRAAIDITNDVFKEYSGKPKFSTFQKMGLDVSLKATGCDQTICVSCNKKELSLPILPNTKTIVTYDIPPSPSGSSYNPF